MIEAAREEGQWNKQKTNRRENENDIHRTYISHFIKWMKKEDETKPKEILMVRFWRKKWNEKNQRAWPIQL